MMTDKKIGLGELYRDLRIARGVKQKDVAKEGLSISQLSKFETGQSMLSADRMLLAIEGIHMTFEEFGLVLRGGEQDIIFILQTEISNLFLKRDLEGLKELLQTKKEISPSKIYNRLLSLVIKSAIHTLDNSYKLTQKDSDFLAHYLYGIEDWTYFELYIFGNTTSFFSDKDLVYLSHELLNKPKKYQSIGKNNLYYKKILLNLISEMIDRGLKEQTYFLINKLESLLTTYDMFEKILLKFFILVLEYLKTNGETRAVVEHYIDSLEIIEDRALVSILREKFKQYDDLKR